MATLDPARRLPPVSPEQQVRRQSLLASSRDLVAGRLSAAWRELVTKLEEDLRRRGDLADERELRQFLYGLREKLLAHADRLQELLAEHWRQEFDAALTEGRLAVGLPKPAKLQLVALGDFDEDLALKAFARTLEEACGDALWAVGRRVAALIGGRRSSDIAAAAAPDIIAAALRRSLVAVDFGLAERIELLRSLVGQSGAGFAGVYREWNELLASFNVLPDLKRSYAKSAPAGGAGPSVPVAPQVAGADVFALLQGAVAAFENSPQQVPSAARNVDTAAALAALDSLQRAGPELGQDLDMQADSLRQFRASDIGRGLGQLDAITVDIVAMLFDMIYQDDAIADPIKVLFGRLQIPLLKVALADRRFFSSRAHPARRFLEQVSHAAVQLGRGAGREDALYGKLVAIVERLQREFSHDSALFDELCLELEGFLVEQDRAADAQAAAAVPLAEAHERRLLAQAAAEQALAPHIAAAPDPIKDLLGHEWRDLLARAHLDCDRGAWDAALSTAAELAASIRIAPGRRRRKEFVERLPGVIRRIQEGFDRLDVDPERRLELIDSLFAMHAALLSGDAGAAGRPNGAAPAAEAGAAVLAGDALLEQVAQLQCGNWIELGRANGAVQRYRISWISPSRAVLLLTNRSSPKGIALTPQALALSIERGRASIVPTEPIFERAMARALSTLTDEDAAKVSLDFT